MTRLFQLLVLLTLIFSLSGCAPAAPTSTPTPTVGAPDATAPSSLAPDGARWLKHLDEDLLPFWDTPDALGNPVGNFPSVRCNDGSRLDRANPCPEVSGNAWLMQDRNYVVSMSRQTYGYGVAFHLTGNPRYLEYARAGVEYLRKNAVDRKNGGAYASWNGEKRAWEPGPRFRNPQELAYSMLGMGFYYYLTRDPAVLADILAVEKYTFSTYYNARINALQWTLSDTDVPALEKRLVAQLDQLNAYMVLLAPILPEPEQSQWKQDMLKLAHILMDEFYSPADNLFFLTVNKPEERSSKVSSTDFGHTIKAMWMIRYVGLLTGQQELVDFAETNGARVLERAFLAENGSWANGVNKGGIVDINKTWWIYCELDQFAASLALQDPAQAQYLPRTTAYWFENFVDRPSGEVWSDVDGKTNRPLSGSLPKAWPWKSAYHSFEHTLVGYITGQQLRGQPVTLFYAFQSQPAADQIRPYFYQGRLTNLKATPSAGLTIFQAEFDHIK